MKKNGLLKKNTTWVMVIFVGILLVFFYFSKKKGNPFQKNGVGENVTQESCLNCHSGMTGFAPAHLPAKIGCASCHLGQIHESDEEKAHEGMVLIPGNLSTANQTCGTGNCHPGIPQRVERSLMNTMSGLITVDRFVFGESDTLNASAHVKDIGHTAADKHLRNLCVSCHLGAEKDISAPVSESSRGGGCLACHINYDHQAIQSLAGYEAGNQLKVHSQLSLNISNDHCFGCHSRSGRISTSYEGWHETQYTDEEVKGKEGFRKLADGRNFQYISEDIHHRAGMDCIDCHNAGEVMGDGQEYTHSEEAVRVRCQDCHFEGKPKTITYEQLDAESQKIISLRKNLQKIKEFIKGKEATEAMINTAVDEAGNAFLITKNSNKKLKLPSLAAVCTQGAAHDDLSCSSCHTPWIPQCIGCHNTYDTELSSYDLLDNKMVKGKWVEHLGVFMAEPPTLGVVETEKERTIKTFVPGMIMTIDESNFPQEAAEHDESFYRLFAPLEAHTISKKGRDCKSCHNNPLAIGYGRGELSYHITNNKGMWEFSPTYENEVTDGLPQDAWVGFMEDYNRIPATRSNARPFTPDEQKRILTVGACLTCHKDDSKIMMEAMDDFEGVLKRVRPVCVLPVWKTED